MPATQEILPISETLEPADAAEIAQLISSAAQQSAAIYPIGGGTSLDYGLPARKPGWGLSLGRLNQVLDYPARDMTITVQAGIAIETLRQELQQQQQQLPIDVPQGTEATLGGVLATNTSGPRRFGFGTMRDYVIGIQAVDGHGTIFRGGGRVVKNVAGYDFCKLLTGSLGTLAVVTEVTLKLKPLPERTALAGCWPRDADQAEAILASMVQSPVTPTAIEWLSGPAWSESTVLGETEISAEGGCLLIGMEGTRAEVDWMCRQLQQDWQAAGIESHRVWRDDEARPLWKELSEFPVSAEAPLVLKITVVPSAVQRLVAGLRKVDPNCSLQAHAGNGVIIARFAEFPAEGLSRTLTGYLEPLAAAAHGNIVVLSNPGGSEMTHQSVWGGIDVPFGLMTEIKKQFDPHDLLNPGRFVYS